MTGEFYRRLIIDTESVYHVYYGKVRRTLREAAAEFPRESYRSAEVEAWFWKYFGGLIE